MASELLPPRRTSALAIAGSHVIPPAPPLPPQRSVPVTARISRWMGLSQRPSTSQPSRLDETRPARRFVRGAGLSSKDASASHRTGLEISSLAINWDGSHAILAGREILKTIRVEEGKCAEVVNLRAQVRSYASHTDRQARQRETFDIRDVAWSKTDNSTKIATAASSGRIVLYDLNRPDVEVARLHEHNRQVHRITFNPFAEFLFLSGSQDGTVRLWDLRQFNRDQKICPSRNTFKGQNDGVRDVKWSPTDCFMFAAGTDGGWVSHWDYRKPVAPVMKIAAHTKNCCSVDWHPDGAHILSASADQDVKVWDFSNNNRRQKPGWELRTPYPMSNARWRPPCNAVVGDERALQCTHIVTSYDRDHPAVHVWDFRRPHLPFRELDCFTTAPTDLTWHSQDLLWTVGREGTFLQTDVQYSPKTVDRRPVSTFCLTPGGELIAAVQKRPKQHKPSLEASAGNPDTKTADPENNSPENLVIGIRSSADDSVIESFLSRSFQKRHGRTGSLIRRKSLGSTPPSFNGSDDKQPAQVMRFDETMRMTKLAKPNQHVFSVKLPGHPNPLVESYFAQNYVPRALPDPPTVESLLNAYKVFDANALVAQRANFYRLGASWKVVGQAVHAELMRRATRQRERRVLGSIPHVQVAEDTLATRAKQILESRRGLQKPLNPALLALQTTGTLQDGQPESSSNVPTPLARPMSDPSVPAQANHASLIDLDKNDSLALPPSVFGTPGNDKDKADMMYHSNNDRDVVQAGFAEPQWFRSPDLNARREMISNWRAQPKQPLSLDQPGYHSSPAPIARHDSIESFPMFSQSTDSRGASFPGSFASELVFSSPYAPAVEAPVEQYSETAMGQNETDLFSAAAEEVPMQQVQRQDPSLPEAEAAQIKLDMARLAHNNQASFSSDSEAYASGNDSLPSAPVDCSRNPGMDMEASGTIVPERSADTDHSRNVSTSMARPTVLQPSTESAQAATQPKHPQNPAQEPFTVADFLPSDHPIEAEQDHPIKLTTLLQKITKWHTDRGEACDASMFLLLMTPLLPRTPALPEAEIAKTIAIYSDKFAAMGFSDQKIYGILTGSFEHLVQTGLQPLQLEAVLATYHERLLALSLFSDAAHLRRLCYPTYPAVYEMGLEDNQIGLMCGGPEGCGKPINNPHSRLRCESCGAKMQPCPVCWEEVSPFGKKRLGALYACCLTCNHSAHVGCLEEFRKVDKSGACVVGGCLCDCAPGSWREALLGREREELLRRVRKGGVVGDGWEAGESRAVERVRGVLKQ
ncbi:SEA (Seh1-associated) complex subunit [Elasticomyces elasticus]|nr:SEA (Seh1-associated) complex subunit [Elasticomyces elasticus]